MTHIIHISLRRLGSALGFLILASRPDCLPSGATIASPSVSLPVDLWSFESPLSPVAEVRSSSSPSVCMPFSSSMVGAILSLRLVVMGH